MSIIEALSEETTPEEARAFYKIFCGDTTSLDDLDQSRVITQNGTDLNKKVAQIKDALMRIQNLSPDHFRIFDLVVEKIYVDGSDVAAGGTTSDAVGLVWSNPHPKFADLDLVEFLVHELTHTLMFLDEWLHAHYTRPLTGEKATWCYSAILKKEGPVDKVLHSIVVASEVILLRQQFIGEPNDPKAHPPTREMKKSLMQSIRSIREMDRVSNILADRSLDLLSRAEAKIGEMKLEQRSVFENHV